MDGQSGDDGRGESRKFRVLLAASGSVATVKVPELATRLSQELHVDVKIILTTAAEHFFKLAERYNPAVQEEFVNLEPAPAVITDKDEWDAWSSVGDPVVHIQLRDWADLLLIAPLSANTLAKMANGLCDNLLTCVVRAWDVRKPLVLAPAMNTAMWDHPLTARHLQSLTELCPRLHIVDPIAKKLACGDVGKGGLAEVLTIVETVRSALS